METELHERKVRTMTDMREFYEDRFRKEDPYGLYQKRELEIINDHKIDLLHRMFPPPGTYERSLDIGCGDAGIFLSHPQCRGTEFSVSLDLSFNAVRRCREHHLTSETRMYFAVADAEDLPFADNIFDFAYCGEVLEHLPKAEKGRDEICRVLQPEGEAVINVPNEEKYILCPSEHLSNFTYSSFKNFVTECFEIELEKGLYLNEISPWDLISTGNPEPRFQELLQLGEARPEDSLVFIFKVQPRQRKSQSRDGISVRESVEIRSAAIDEEEVMRTIEQNLQRRSDLYSSLDRERPHLPSYNTLLGLEPAAVSDTLSYHLWRARKVDMVVEQRLVPSRIPLFGQLVDRVKLQFHNLVLYYVNMRSAERATAYANLTLALQLMAQELAYLRDQIGEREKKGDPEN